MRGEPSSCTGPVERNEVELWCCFKKSYMAIRVAHTRYGNQTVIPCAGTDDGRIHTIS